MPCRFSYTPGGRNMVRGPSRPPRQPCEEKCSMRPVNRCRRALPIPRRSGSIATTSPPPSIRWPRGRTPRGSPRQRTFAGGACRGRARAHSGAASARCSTPQSRDAARLWRRAHRGRLRYNLVGQCGIRPRGYVSAARSGRALGVGRPIQEAVPLASAYDATVARRADLAGRFARAAARCSHQRRFGPRPQGRPSGTIRMRREPALHGSEAPPSRVSWFAPCYFPCSQGNRRGFQVAENEPTVGGV